MSFFVKKIITAENGKEGLELFKKQQDSIDIIITDILMPKMDGIEMVKKIRSTNLHIPIIFTTAFSDTSHLKKAAGLSIDGYITKPIDIEKLVSTIDKTIKKIKNINASKNLTKQNIELTNEVEKNKQDLKTLNLILQRKNKELLRQLYTDDLTELSNRKALNNDLLMLENPFVIIIDIDSFKKINSFYGLDIGNHILKNFASFLKKYKQFKVYRTGSDDFTLVLQKAPTFEVAKNIIENIIKDFKQKQFFHPQTKTEIYLDITIGASLPNGDRNVYKDADLALKKAQKDRTPYLFFSDGIKIDEEFERDIRWTQIIKDAISNNNITLYFQPIIDHKQDILKYECLIRLVKDDKIITPNQFLDIAKRTKLYLFLTQIVIEKAFEVIKLKNITLSVNLSAQDIANPQIRNFIIENLEKFEVAKNIIFEILESESIDNFKEVLHFVDSVKKMGAKIAIDDFGSGYSNFSYLLNLKPDYIKIDGSVVKNIHKDKRSYIITKAINHFAHSLDIKTVAEYVHNKDVFDITNEIGIDEYQGYYFAKPLEKI